MLNKGNYNYIISKKRLAWLKQDYLLYLMLLPGIVYYIIFHYGPMYGIVIAFQNYNINKGIFGSEWVGLDNFRQLLSLPDFYRILVNTISLNIYYLIFGFPIPIIIALLLNEINNKRFVRISNSLMYLPHFFSWVVLGGVIMNILSPRYGIVNQIIKSLGFNAIYFLGDKKWWVFTYVVSAIWKEAGWGAIIYTAALTGIDTTLYAAARVDGANRWKQLVHVTLPGIKPTIAVMFILRLGNLLFISFEQPFILSNPMVIDRADVISTFIYTAGITQGQFSLTTAMGMFQSVIGLILILASNKIIKSMGEEGIF